jgi:hypothetical protein
MIVPINIKGRKPSSIYSTLDKKTEYIIKKSQENRVVSFIVMRKQTILTRPLNTQHVP